MNLINILVIAVSILTILSAFALVCGSTKSYRFHSLWFLAAAIGEVMWAGSIAIFLSLGTGEFDFDIAPVLAKGIYVGAILMDSTILGYVAWRYRWGKVATSIFVIAGIILSAIFLYDPSVLYSAINLTSGGNSVTIDMSSGFYIAYIVYFCTIVPAFSLALIYSIRHTHSKDVKKGYLFFLIGLGGAGFLSLIFDLIMPVSRYDLIWVGPLAIGITMLGFYYAVLRYRIISLTTSWLKALSSIVIISAAAILYLLIFHVVFSALFKVASPSFQVILLNFIMVAIVLILAPAISETMSLVRSLIITKQIDVAYIVKKITRLNRKKLDYLDVSGFLAEHMHFEYVGLLVGNRYYVNEDYRLSADELKKLIALGKPERGIWQNITSLGPTMRRDREISRVAAITDASGHVLGQVVFGHHTVKSSLDKTDLTEIEIVVDLIGTIINQ